MTGLAGLAFVIAAFLILIDSVASDSNKPKTTLRRLFGLVILFAYFFFRFWVGSTYHPFPMPALFAFVVAAIAAFAASFNRDQEKVEDQQKKGAGITRRL